MSFFQQSVLNKYFQQLSEQAVNVGYEKFKKFFFDLEIQKNIDEAKEEQMQENFLRELFGNVLGYTHFPHAGYNLTTEYKNETGSKKADGAILKDGKAIAVIELKGTNTPDLGKVEQQAFNYKNNQTGCEYVIISNFEKLRFFIHDAVSHIEFNLFTLSAEEFKLLWLCLHKDSIYKGIPEKIKQESISAEDKVTKQLYADYSVFKNELWQDLVKNNPAADKLLLYQKSQKLLDRFLFIYFSEDKGLLPPNSINEIIKQWEELKERDEYRPLYDRIKKYFGYMNLGWKGKTYEIFAYNGGLFHADNLLDNFKISDDVLSRHMKQLSTYDFSSEVDVNILGHIFEHSLSEIEAVTAQLEGREHDESKSKRKKDGVFYTPKYITKYIVENTIGKLCEEKKTQLGIFEEEFAKGRKNRKKETIKILDEKLKQYRKWLLSITICDPACGSGAFLNQALDFLIKEHHYIDELLSLLLGNSIVFPDIENHILENNIYGVDINEESTEIARLSLWLRTAQKGRKLSSLNNNIRCGNSLIEDPAVAGDKAFNWQKEFPAVFTNGGFDVVIGNPPWGAKFTENEKRFHKIKYPKSTEGKVDSYRIFIEKCFELGAASALISLITPNTFLYNLQSYSLRDLIFKCASIYDAVELRKNIFEDAPDVVPVIISFENQPKEKYSFRGRVAYHNIPCIDIATCKWEIDQIIQTDNLKKDKDLKINLRSNFNFSNINIKVGKLNSLGNDFNLRQGTKPYGKKEEREVELLSKTQSGDSWEKAINGRNISRYFLKFENDYVQRSNELHSALSLDLINQEKIYFQRMRKISLFPRVVACYDNNQMHGLYTCSVITRKKESPLDLKYLLCLLNSKFINLWFKYFDTDIEIKLASVSQIPAPIISNTLQQPFIKKAEAMLTMNKELNEVSQKFQRSLERKFELTDLSNKLLEWHLLSYPEFIKELAKKKKKLSLSDEAEWETYFLQEQKKAQDLKAQIDSTDKSIDQMVYELFELTEPEIKIIENTN